MSSLPILYVFNDISKRYVKKDGNLGKKIIREKKLKNQTISYFQDSKGQKLFLGNVETKKGRCPKGQNRDKVTGECVSKKDLVKPKKRCPNGTRRDPKTKKCISKKLSKKSPPIISPVQNEIPKPISQNLETGIVRQENTESTLEKMYQKYNLSFSDLASKWSIVNVPPDHFCGYHSLSLFLRMIKDPFVSEDETENIDKLIKKLYDSYVAESKLANSNIEKSDILKRLQDLKDADILSKWMTDEDMVLYSKIFKICFVVLRKDPTLNMLHWQILTYDSSLAEDFQNVYSQCKRNKKLIFLYNPDYPGLHYDLLLPEVNVSFPKFTDYDFQNEIVGNPLFQKSYTMESKDIASPNQYIIQLSPQFQSTDYSSAQKSSKKSPKSSISPVDKQYIVQLTPEYQSTDYSSAQQSPPKKSPPKKSPPKKSVTRKSPFVRHQQDQLRSMIQKCFNK